MSEAVLAEHRVIWSEKPALRAIYTDFYRRILARELHALASGQPTKKWAYMDQLPPGITTRAI